MLCLTVLFYFVYFFRLGFPTWPQLCRPGWLWASYPPASTSPGLGFHEYVAMFDAVLRMEPRTSCAVGKYSAHSATPAALTALVNRIVLCNVHTKHRQLSVSLVYSELFVKPVLTSSFILFLHQRETNPLAFTFSLSQSHCLTFGRWLIYYFIFVDLIYFGHCL